MPTAPISVDPSEKPEKKPEAKPSVVAMTKQYATNAQIKSLTNVNNIIETVANTDPNAISETATPTATAAYDAMQINLMGIQQKIDALKKYYNKESNEKLDQMSKDISKLLKKSPDYLYTNDDAQTVNKVNSQLKDLLTKPQYDPDVIKAREQELHVLDPKKSETQLLEQATKDIKNKLATDFNKVASDQDQLQLKLYNKYKNIINSSNAIDELNKELADKLKNAPPDVQKKVKDEYNAKMKELLKNSPLSGLKPPSLGDDPEKDMTLEKQFYNTVLNKYMPLLDAKLAKYVDALTFDNTAVGWFNDITSKSLDLDQFDQMLDWKTQWGEKFSWTNDGSGNMYYALKQNITGQTGHQIADQFVTNYTNNQKKIFNEVTNLRAPVDAALAQLKPPFNPDQQKAFDNLTTIKNKIDALLAPGSKFQTFCNTTISVSTAQGSENRILIKFTAPDGSSLANGAGIDKMDGLFNGCRDDVKAIDDTTKASLDKFNNVTEQNQLMLQQVFTEIQQIWSIIATCLQILNEGVMTIVKNVKTS